jgi:hypothetical protein
LPNRDKVEISPTAIALSRAAIFAESFSLEAGFGALANHY